MDKYLKSSKCIQVVSVEDDRKKSHGSSATARGKAAMAGMASSSSAAGSSDGQSVRVTAADGGQSQAVQVDVQVGELGETLEVKLRVSAEKKSTTTRGYETEQTLTKKDERTSEGVRSYMEAREDLPWLLRRYRDEPSNGNDVWDEALWEAHGWLVRVHKRRRVRPFHPLHRTTPGGGKELGSRRVTMFFQGKRQVGVHQDDWQDPANSNWDYPVGQWKGYTFFRKKNDDEEPDDPKERTATSDGSYERIDEEDPW